MKLLDLFCGAGGAAMGYYRVGFTEIVGVDIEPQPRYPFTFVQADAMTYPLDGFDAIHASPPCQGYSVMRNLPWLRHRVYHLLILPTRERLEAAGVPYVIENVAGARHGAKGLVRQGIETHGMKAGWLCGAMFGIPIFRHRYFETNWFWLQPGHPRHRGVIRPGRKLGDRAATAVYPDGKPNINAWMAQSGQLMGHNGHRAFPSQSKSIVSMTGGLERGMRGKRTKGNGAQAPAANVGHAAGFELAKKVMGIDWMRREEFTQAVPPAYTEYIGQQLLKGMTTGTSRVVA